MRSSGDKVVVVTTTVEVETVVVVTTPETMVVAAGSVRSELKQPRPKPNASAMTPSPIGMYSRMSFR